MPNYSKNDIILVRYPFSDLSTAKIRPAVYERIIETIEDEGLYSAMMEVKQETPLSLEEALAELNQE